MAFSLLPYHEPDFSRLQNAPDADIREVQLKGVAPANFHAMSIYPEYFKVDGKWILAEESRMDCVPVLSDGKIRVVEFRHLHPGDRVICGRTEDGSEGIYVHVKGFVQESSPDQLFAFRQGRSRETAFSREYDELYELLRHEREHGKIVWVLGPAFSFDYDARNAFVQLVETGYVHGLLAGNALAVHDLEGAYLGTALGQDIYTQMDSYNGHYHHLDTINQARMHGTISAMIEKEHLENGIMRACTLHHVPYVLAGSIRDDGPLPETIGNVYTAQDEMRDIVRSATTVICMATMLHTIATGNMVPSYRVTEDGTVRPVYFYCVDISEFVVRKLADRGSLSAKGFVTNVQDFIVNVAKGLKE